MDFFAQQAKAHSKTKLLVGYFALAVISMIVLIYLGAVFVSSAAHSQHRRGYRHYDYSYQPPISLWNPLLFLGVAAGTLGVIALGSGYKTMMLSAGGSAVAESLDGRLLSPNTQDLNERKLLNVVEEMAIASGVPMPKVYVLDQEAGINAFAAGHTPSDAAVAVTRGCLTGLTRDELQGVIGHEFSHILNGDMRLNVRLIGILFGIFCLATLGRVLLYARGDSRDRNALPLIGLLLVVLGSLGVFFGRLIQAAVSRQREFLADASSVQFTRNPLGLSRALQKIGARGSALASPHAADACHLFFANGISEAFFGIMATHPPLPDRIRAIDPGWDGTFKEPEAAADHRSSRAPTGTRTATPPPIPDRLQTVLGGAVIASAGTGVSGIPSHSVMPNLGNPTPMHLQYAEALRNALPETLQAAAQEPASAMAMVYALILSPDETLRARQLAELADRTSPSIAAQTAALYPDVTRTAARARLPLINLALPALRQMTAPQYSQFSATLAWLIDSDGQVEVFEFVVQKIVLRHLAPQFSGPRKAVVQYYTLKPLVPDAAVILSALAHVGSDDPAAVARAFAEGAPYLRAPEPMALLPLEQCGLAALDAALNRLALAVPNIKKNLLEACARVAGADGVIYEGEAELLRAVADTLDCPMPPLGVTE